MLLWKSSEVICYDKLKVVSNKAYDTTTAVCALLYEHKYSLRYVSVMNRDN